MQLNKKQLIELLDKTYGQKEVYMWSTYILPNGNFLNPENNKNSDIDDLSYEHSDFWDYLPDEFANADEQDIMEYAMKMNVTYPYIILPKNRITPEQVSALKKIIFYSDQFEYNLEDIIERLSSWSSKEIENLPSILHQPLLVQHETMGNTVFDIMEHSANDIVKEIMKAYSRGTF